MRIYAMTATFGKLIHETLTLQPGLNIIHAPNEWGKSTWCAFLAAMLYGLDTRAKTTKAALADKERFAPWSGELMAGRMDIHWQGRDITIERKTKGRVPLGDFRAYETASGLAVEELTATNCGAVLLGVEKSVFVRAGFIRFQDLPVTEDDALRRRLNALVTTGDESRTGDVVAKSLRELKNRIRYNRTGLLPQAEGECAALEETLKELHALQDSAQKARTRLLELEEWNKELENHRAALAYAAAQADAQQVEVARAALAEGQEALRRAEENCVTLPPREQVEQVLARIKTLQERQSGLELELRMLPEQAEAVPVPGAFAGLGAEEIAGATKEDCRNWARYQKTGRWLLPLAVLLALGGGALAVWYLLPGLVAAGAGLMLLAVTLVLRGSARRKARALEVKYGSSQPRQWLAQAEEYSLALARQEKSREEIQAQKQSLEQRLQELNGHIQAATNGESLEQCCRDWEGAIAAWNAREAALRDKNRLAQHYHTLKTMARSAPAPERPDAMDYSQQDTARLLSDCFAQRHRLENRLGQCQGRMEALGSQEELEERLQRTRRRIAELEETYAALTIAQETLAEATAELQRRFAPRISKRAQELLAQLTGGRYTRLSLDKNLAVRAGAETEDTLREALWRSDGTVDQLYLALRLAVAEELTPGAPLILDDALVRFDDQRLKAALDILEKMAEKKQVLLFSCHTRERELYGEVTG